MNDTLIGSLTLLETGEQQLSISIPVKAFTTSRFDGRSSLTFNLVSDESCDFDLDVIVNVSANSFLVLPHKTGVPTINLSRLPYPIFQRSPLQPSSAVMVIPDKPSLDEMRAMIEVASGFGSMSGGKLLLSSLYASELTPEILAANHLVFVGKPQAFAQLAQVTLPAPVSGSTFNPTAGIQADDGVIQMAKSPWNPALVVLLVSGNTDKGVIKAGHAINVGDIFTIGRQDLAIVQDVHPGVRMLVPGYDLRFSDLGLQDRTIRGIVTSSTSQSNNTDIVFYVPSDKQVGLNSFVEIHYNHSEQLDYSNSGLAIQLNGRTIGSAGFSKDDVRPTAVKIMLPRSAVLPGKNTISILVSMYPKGVCESLYNQPDAMWTTIYSDSVLHVSLEDILIPRPALWI